MEQGNTSKDPIVVENIGKSANTTQKMDTTTAVSIEGNHKNRFEILQDTSGETQKSPRDSMREQDVLLEQEINEELEQPVINHADAKKNIALEADDDSNSNYSEFVDATQIQLFDGHNVDQSSPEKINTNVDINVPARQANIEIQNKQFLEQSWANMAEDVDAEKRLIQHLESDPHILTAPANAEDFQVVSRKKGKTIKKPPLSKSQYSTRAKASNVKPFKWRCCTGISHCSH